MVVFTCNNCGESLQKPKVAKHYQFQCRSSESLTCVDCHKDFYGQEYVAHTKCISESERYGGQEYVAKPGQNKGEKKQQEWINIVKNVFDTATNLSQEERHVLNILSKHENIPRKKAKFLNFIRNIMGPRVNMSVIDSVWTKMETAFKGSAQQNNQTSNTNDKENGNAANGSSPTKSHESNVAENQNNENIVRENGNAEPEAVEAAANGGERKKKSKKRDLNAEPKTDEPDEPASKKRKKKPKAEEESPETVTTVEQQEDNQEEAAKFDWKATILEIVGSKQEIAVKKLRKKVVNRYLNYCGNSVTFEKAASRFDKKLRKTSEVTLNDDKVRLI